MTLKAIVDSIDDLPTDVQEHYTKMADGKFALDISGAPSAKDVSALSTSLAAERDSHKATKGTLSKYKELGPLEEIVPKLAKFPELELAAAGKLDDDKINGMVERRLAAKTAPLERRVQELTTAVTEKDREIGDLRGSAERAVLTAELQSAARKAGVRDSAVDDVVEIGAPLFELVDGRPVVRATAKNATPGLAPSDWLAAVKQTRSHWWPDSAGGGAGGSRGGRSGEPNPWSNEFWNVTQQMSIVRADATRADKLAAAAGTRVGGPKPAAKK